MDPCPGTCGFNARCQVINHNPICSCNPGYNGDPFVRCNLETSKKLHSSYLLLQLSKCLCFIFFLSLSWCGFPLFFPEYVCRITCTEAQSKSLCPLPLWTQLTMSSDWGYTCLLVLTELHRTSAQLPPRMYNKFRVSGKFSMHK